MTKDYPSQRLKQVLLRIPDAMREKLEDITRENGRSLTAEVLMRLERTFREDEQRASRGQDVLAGQDQIDWLQARYEELRHRMDEMEADYTALKDGLDATLGAQWKAVEDQRSTAP